MISVKLLRLRPLQASFLGRFERIEVRNQRSEVGDVSDMKKE